MRNIVDEFFLNKYLPNGALYLVMPYLEKHQVQLVINKERKTLLGNYSFTHLSKQHKITINHNLNPQTFLVTLLHELAHLITFEKYKNRVPGHGKEWKKTFTDILQQFILNKIFHDDVEAQLIKSIANLKASSCADIHLAKVLMRYDIKSDETIVLIQDIKENELFVFDNKRKFKMIGKARKRYLCEEVGTKQRYMFYALCEVKKTII